MASHQQLPSNATLILVDVQNGLKAGANNYYGEARSTPNAEQKMALLLARWRATSRPVIFVQHISVNADSPLRPGQPGVDIQDIVKRLETEPVITKNVNSSFIGTDLEQRLREQIRTEHVVICGLTADQCVSTTVRMAGNLGFKTYLAADGCAAFGKAGPSGKYYDAETIHDTALASLSEEFATVLPTDALLELVPLA
ncbi:Isochorismatase hydrolase [Phlyctochytrium arcticum]|nr:Isochorismatase hydrolase [Phlyctochytrium arcticum]